MTEVLFYHLEHKSLEDVLPGLLEKTRERGWKALVRAGSDERIAALDAHLWSYREESFLAHGLDRDPHLTRANRWIGTLLDLEHVVPTVPCLHQRLHRHKIKR